jgi:hypothetical protein
MSEIEAVRSRRVKDALEAQPVDQGGMVDEELAQVGHEALAFVEFDKISGDEGSAEVRQRSGEGAVGRALGELRPGERADERAILGDEWVALDPGRQPGERVLERAGVVGRRRGRMGRAREGGAQPLERTGKIE